MNDPDPKHPSSNDGTLILVSFGCVLAAVVLRVLGAFHSVIFIYASIGSSALAAVLLVVAVRRNRRRAE